MSASASACCPPDGLLIVGYARNVKDLYMMTAHSGMALTPILGRFATTEILDDGSVSVLELFRPRRFG